MDEFAANPPVPPPLPAVAAPASPPQAQPMMLAQPASPFVMTSDDRSMGMLCHLLGIFTGFLGPLILWLLKKDSSPYVDHHGREALNFQLTLLIVLLALGSVTFVLMFVLIGIALVPVILVIQVAAIVLEILAAVAAQNGQWHRYPFNMRMV